MDPVKSGWGVGGAPVCDRLGAWALAVDRTLLKRGSNRNPPPPVAAVKAGARSPSFNFNSIAFAMFKSMWRLNRFNQCEFRPRLASGVIKPNPCSQNSGERSRLGCGSARPRAELERTGRHRTVG